MHSRVKLLFAVNGVGALVTMGFWLIMGEPNWLGSVPSDRVSAAGQGGPLRCALSRRGEFHTLRED
jgi:hypothetical protein